VIRYRCPNCKADMESPDSLAGWFEKCPVCGYKVKVPQPKSIPDGLEGELIEAVPEKEAIKQEQIIHVYSTPTNESNALPKKVSGATLSLVCGIVGLFFFGILFGLLAVVFGIMAYSTASKYPKKYTGKEEALAGVILGFIDIAAWILIMAWLFGDKISLV